MAPSPEFVRQAAVRDVELATLARRRVDADADAARVAQSGAIRAALSAGVPATTITAITGLSLARIYQIRSSSTE